MNTLRKRPTYNDMIKSINNPPVFKYKEPKGIKILNDIIISNFLFTDNIIDDKIINESEKMLMLDKYTQKDYPLQSHDLFPDMFYKISATSEYQPNILKNKSDNINQTTRYMLKQIGLPSYFFETPPSSSSSSSSDRPPDNSGDYSEWYRQQYDPDPNVKTPSQSENPISENQEEEEINITLPPTPEATPNKKGNDYSPASSRSRTNTSNQSLHPNDGVMDLGYPTRPSSVAPSSRPLSIASSRPISIRSSVPISVVSSVSSSRTVPSNK